MTNGDQRADEDSIRALVDQQVNGWAAGDPATYASVFPARRAKTWIESFNGRRDELLNSWHFDSLLEASVIIEDWRRDYNTNRPHSAPLTANPPQPGSPYSGPRPTNPKPHSDWTTKPAPSTSPRNWTSLSDSSIPALGTADGVGADTAAQLLVTAAPIRTGFAMRPPWSRCAGRPGPSLLRQNQPSPALPRR